MKNRKRNHTYFIYTLTFFILAALIFFPFIIGGRSFVWHMDGVDQHYPALVYYGKLLRGLLSGKGFSMVDFNIGMGFDTLTTLNYYAIGDPISLLSVFMTSSNSIYLYDFLILLRIYLAGISFILLMKYFKRDGVRAALGALIYAFCGFSFYAGLRHPFFMNPLIYLPLILIGVEQLLKGKKPYLMILMVFISTLSNFYFFYDLTMITIIYIIFRYVTLYRKNYKNPIVGLLQTGLKTGGYYLLGSALASFLFLPILYAFSLNGRLDAHPSMVNGYFLYGLKYYRILLQGMFSSNSDPNYWTVLSFPAIAAVSLAIVIANRQYRKLQLIYLMIFVGLSIPAFGYFMNGLSYDANRWSFLVSLIIATTFTWTYDKLFELGNTDKLCLILVTAIIGVFAFVFPSKPIVKIAFILLFFVALILFLLQMEWFKSKEMLRKAIIYGLVILSIGFNGYGFFSRHFNNYTKEFLSYNEVKYLTSKGELSVIPAIKDNSFYRIETYGEKALNSSLAEGYHDVSAYYSLMDGDITSYLKGLEVLNQRTAFRFTDLDNRTILDSLAGVKYLVTTDKKTAPYGYTLYKRVNSGPQNYYVYQNSYPLSIGYTYDNYMLKSDYDKLSALEKQNAMMSSVILNQESDYAKQTKVLEDTGIMKLNAKITPNANVTLSKHLITVNKAGAKITLRFKAQPNSETYIRFGKLNIMKKEDIMINFNARSGKGATKEINVRSPYNNNYFAKENYLINTGYSAKGKTKVIITFPKKVTLRYDSLEVYSVDMSYYQNKVKALSSASLTNVTLGKNRLEGDINLNNKGLMVLSIPYSAGWKAYVDGTAVKPLPANGMYMALPLYSGNHHIILKYGTPYLKTGFIISLAAFIILIGVLIFNRYKEKNKT